MLAEYAAERLQGVAYATHLRLGMPVGLTRDKPNWRSERQYHLATLPEADLVWRTDEGAVIAEFAVWNPIMKVGQLLLYRALLPSTPGYEDLKRTQITCLLVLGRAYPLAEAEAGRRHIKLDRYAPEWLRAELATRRGGAHWTP